MSDHAQEHTHKKEICVKIPLVFEELNVFCLWLTKAMHYGGRDCSNYAIWNPTETPCYAG